jgi:outer membrane protein TolC
MKAPAVLIFAIIFSALNGTPGIADQQVKIIGVDEAVSIALKNSHDYKIALIKAGQAKERVNLAWSQLMPAIESEASASRQYAENGPMSLSDGMYDIRFLQMRLAVNPGAVKNSLEAARKGHESARQELRRVRAGIELSAIKAYFDLLLAREIITLRKDSVSVLKANRDDVSNQFKTGSVPKYDLLQAEVRLRSQEPLVPEAENAQQVALERFNFFLGQAAVLYTADPALLENDPAVFKITDAGLNDLLSAALKNRPEILMVELQMKTAADSGEAHASFYMWPTFAVAGSYGISKYLPNPVDIGMPATPGFNPDFTQLSGDDRWQNTWQVRASATYRWSALMPTDRDSVQEREWELKAREAEAELEKLKQLTAISVRAACSKAATSSESVKSRRENVEAAKEGLRIARESYRAGVIKNSELLAAELALTGARADHISAIHSYYTAAAELKRETGLENLNIQSMEK